MAVEWVYEVYIMNNKVHPPFEHIYGTYKEHHLAWDHLQELKAKMKTSSDYECGIKSTLVNEIKRTLLMDDFLDFMRGKKTYEGVLGK